MIIGQYIVFLNVQQAISDNGIDKVYLRLIAGCLLLIPGTYQSILAVMAMMQVEGFTYEMLIR